MSCVEPSYCLVCKQSLHNESYLLPRFYEAHPRCLRLLYDLIVNDKSSVFEMMRSEGNRRSSLPLMLI